ncbi:MAG: dihydropteroate synthase [Succinivibrio sp.]|nr:dihydropteroate synthase [Succinivibrio sp.]
MKIAAFGRELSLDSPKIMGILNVTPDSFSDGGRYNTTDKALDHAAVMVEEGASIIDIGGESTRPGAAEVSLDEELSRVVPVVETISCRLDVMISVDTSQPEVMKSAVEAGAHIINDIRALSVDGALSTVADLNCPVILMHMQGKPRTMQIAPHYTDVVAEVRKFLLNRAEACLTAGIRKENLILDPGFGFGKSVEDNYRLLAHLEELVDTGYPVLSALSRKSMIGAACGISQADLRVTGSVAGALISVMKGACLVRVHDVAQTREALDVYRATRNSF